MRHGAKKLSQLAIPAVILVALAAAAWLPMLFAFSRVRVAGKPGDRVLRTAGEGRCRTLDPIQADDSASRNICGAVYDTLLAYDYLARPYKLVPSMLAELPTPNADGSEYRFRLRDDLRFPDREGIPGRRITAPPATPRANPFRNVRFVNTLSTWQLFNLATC